MQLPHAIKNGACTGRPVSDHFVFQHRQDLVPSFKCQQSLLELPWNDDRLPVLRMSVYWDVPMCSSLPAKPYLRSVFSYIKQFIKISGRCHDHFTDISVAFLICCQLTIVVASICRSFEGSLIFNVLMTENSLG